MLLIRRKAQERVLIGDVWVTVVRSGSTNVTLGIEAPDGTRVVREELLTQEQLDELKEKGHVSRRDD